MVAQREAKATAQKRDKLEATITAQGDATARPEDAKHPSIGSNKMKQSVPVMQQKAPQHAAHLKILWKEALAYKDVSRDSGVMVSPGFSVCVSNPKPSTLNP